MKTVNVPFELLAKVCNQLLSNEELHPQIFQLLKDAENPKITIEEFTAKLERPIVFLDAETTGTNTAKDRVVSLSFIKVWIDGTTEGYNWLMNPTIPIPEAASEVHGITDEEVMFKPTFCDLKEEFLDVLAGCDLGHFNGDKFDVPLLCEEFHRCGIQWPPANTVSVDVSNIFRKKEGRSLVDAVKFYLQEDFTEAHNAEHDTESTLMVLLAQLKRYPEYFAMSLKELAAETCYNPDAVDIAGKFAKNADGEYVYTFGKHKDQRVKDFPSYIDWMLGGDFTADTKRHGKLILQSINYI